MFIISKSAMIIEKCNATKATQTKAAKQQDQLCQAEKPTMPKQARKIYPVFIPMQGCEHRCIYCDQNKISGFEGQSIDTQIAGAARFVQNNPEIDKEIAFYGGSFTALSFAKRTAIVNKYKEIADEKTSFRISTHPLHINPEILSQCKAERIVCIELGIQDFNTKVLKASGRPYNSALAQKSARLVKDSGFTLGIQLMPGLPGSNATTIARNMHILSELKPNYLRLYPVIVIKGTPLAELYRKGLYHPLELHEAMEICADYSQFAQVHGIKIIKLGLPSNLDCAEVVAGPHHPAFGELVSAELLIRQIVASLQEGKEIVLDKKQRALIMAHRGIGKAILEKRLENCSLNKKLISGLW